MNKLAIALILVAGVLTGCNKKTVSANSANSSDAVETKLQAIAGPDAKNCGRVKSVAEADTKPASECAIQSAQAKKPFYVAYDMPGLTVAVAGSSDGKLYAVQSQSPAPAEGQQPAQSSGPAELTVTPCPSELRIASSGRVTCYPMSSFGAATGANPHGGGMMMPPASGANPHGGMTMPPAGTPNPHGGSMMSPDMPSAHGSAKTGSATKNDKAGQKDASKQ